MAKCTADSKAHSREQSAHMQCCVSSDTENHFGVQNKEMAEWVYFNTCCVFMPCDRLSSHPAYAVPYASQDGLKGQHGPLPDKQWWKMYGCILHIYSPEDLI